ncbi:gliding motility-associated C-terminal domain-containing protein, partial [Saprospiraceae bacterium]|nr:gliding motility-associated C-terminal domain-containing protein [Saprospiraceae bacterium]
QANGCDSTFIIDLTVRENYTQDAFASICSGEVYPFGTQTLTDAGTYTGGLTSIYGCDSSVVLTLDVEEATFSQIEATICEGEFYDLEGTVYRNAGSYQAVTNNVNNCDSTIFLDLETISWNGGVELPLDTVINLGSDIIIIPVYVAPDFLQTVWLDEAGEVLSNDPTLLLTGVTQDHEITMTAVDEYGCVDKDNIVIRVDRNIGIYTPNIFSPNGDVSNDYFRSTVNESIGSLKEINIYDRWGNLVYHRENLTDLSVWQGWDGKFNGKDAVSGVYVYISTFLALDGKEENVSGDITLIR